MAGGSSGDRTRNGRIESVTWNPTTGRDVVSYGCDRCYALAFADLPP